MAWIRQCVTRLGGCILVFYLFIFLLRAGRLDYEQLQANDLVGVWFIWAKPIHEYKGRNNERGWGKKEE